MSKIFQATCNNGNLILDEKLSNEWEGKSFQVILVENDEIEVKKQRFFEFVERSSFTLPDDYQFNREELYER
ncbi:hypothetical protein [Argonema galeatum]|uniref:hypothetical protein n=1 Tax=Argonema galeatum TaxID=2942762 RepID=UPI002010F6D4|nr:hypothetical protein [Argonema galeatum]MCL1464356.1 hypothetical protein [Argonema galeatum A003/A1]